MSLLSKLAGRLGRRDEGGPDLSGLAPERPFTAIGDVHGRLDLLEPRLRAAKPGEPLVMVGDYVDRGPDSAGVLKLLNRLDRDGRAICLTGNHEAMLLDFLDAPGTAGPRWLTNGGMQTLWSFGIQPGAGDAEESMQMMAAALRARLGPLEDWLRGLPVMWRSGNVAVVHAATDPALPINGQKREVLIWGRPRPGQPPRPDGVWVVHGHTIVPEVEVTRGRVNIDTGAFSTGLLSAVRVGRERLEILP